jgi:L-ascorbate metabolism protein UlaG (beta-lactamase superfamily)
MSHSRAVKVTYVGHATVIVEFGKRRFITDPLLTKRIARIGPRRKVSLELDKKMLEGIEFAVVSHGHFDHLDKRSLCMLPPEAPVVICPKLSGIVHRSCRRTAVGIGWWEMTDINGVKVTGVPAYHFSARPPFHWSDDYQGYVVELHDGDRKRTIYHAGDCGMSEYFEQIGKKFKLDIACLPIGAYEPPSFRKHHLAPEDALDALEMTGANVMIPIHWGTYNLSWEPFDEPPKRLMDFARKRGLEDRVRLLWPGESTTIE